MGKYYQALQRLKVEPEFAAPASASADRAANSRAGATRALVPSALPEKIPAALLQAAELRSISERIAPLAVVESSTRLLVAACNRGDGASTVAATLALDLSQRLQLRTLLIDAHLRHPDLHLLFNSAAFALRSGLSERGLQIRPTDLGLLDLMSLTTTADGLRQEALKEIEKHSLGYQAVIVDLGVPRLDPRMLGLARDEDPIVLVVRYGHTERTDLSVTVGALRAANRSIAGVIINDKTVPSGKLARRLIGS